MKRIFMFSVALSFVFCGGNVNPQPPNPAFCLLSPDVISQIGILTTVYPKITVCKMESAGGGKRVTVATIYPCGTSYSNGDGEQITKLKALVIRGVDFANTQDEYDYSEMTLSVADYKAETLSEYVGGSRTLLIQDFGEPNPIIADALKKATSFMASGNVTFLPEETLMKMLDAWVLLSIKQCSGLSDDNEENLLELLR